jgi:exonuclease SbcC
MQKIKLDEAFKASTLALNWVQTLAVLRDDFKKYQQEFTLISKEKEDKKEDFLKLKLADKALHVSVIHNKKKHLEESLHVSNASIVSLKKELAKLGEDILQNSQSYMLLFKSTQEAEKEFEIQNEKLKNARAFQVQEKEIEKNISILQALLKTKSSQEEKLSLHVKRLNENFESFEKQLLDKKKYLQEHITDEKLLSDLSAIEQILKQFHNEDSSSKSAKSDFSNIQESLKIKESTLKSIEAEIEILKLTCKTKEQELLLQKYAQDRAKLEEGEACFLCGATEHPYVKNSLNVSSDETQDMINELQQKMKLKQNREDEQYALRIEISSIQAKREQFELNIKTSTEKLDTLMQSLKSYSANFSIENLDSHYKILLERKKAYLDAQESVKKIEEKSLTCKLDKKESETQLLSLKDELLSTTQKLHELEVRLESLVKERILVLNVANLESYEKEINLTCKLKQKADQEAKNRLEALKIKQEEQLKQEKALADKIKEDEKQLQEFSKKLQEQLEENDFKSEKELENAIVSHDVYESLSLTCKSIDRQYTQINTLKIETEKRLEIHQKETKTDKSATELETELQALQEESDRLQLNIGSDEKELELNLKNEIKHKEKIASLQKRKEAFKVWMKLQELVGSADGTKFKKFAQGITLDQLISLANAQLNVLSERYTLIRSSEEKQVLELEVVDAFQGNISRSVNTLSGGESFIVSLALALGLSSLSSQKIAIDSLFLDEGFGTLDTENLEMALNALNLLQSSGKMVGVISHVKALKERIPLQIKVIANGDGTSCIEI